MAKKEAKKCNISCGILKHMVSCGGRLRAIANFLSPFLSVGIRFWIAVIFWNSGLLKISDWDSTLMLFEHEHPVPYLPIEFAAISGTAMELIMPMLLIIGFATRFAAIPLLIMTVVIQYTYMSSSEHLVWALFLGVIILQGPGRFSWDYFIRRKFATSDCHKAGIFSHVLAIIAVAVLTVFAGHEIATASIESWNTPWFTSLFECWQGIDKSLGSFYRD